MVNTNVVTFEAVCRSSLNWRVSIDGDDVHIPFANCETCIEAAKARARRHHLDHGVTTEVWAPGYGGKRECVVRFMTPEDLDAMIYRSDASIRLRDACDEYGSMFPCL